MTFLRITEAQAADLRGMYGPNHALDPVLLPETGDYILTDAVLSHPAFESVLATLQALPTYPAWGGSGIAYSIGDVVEHEGRLWRCINNHNSQNDWLPGVAHSLWTVAHVDGIIPVWTQPQGSHDAYPLGMTVLHNGELYDSLISNNVWEPGAVGSENLWQLQTEEQPGEPDAWVQPTGGHNAYALDALVTHNGRVWLSLMDANVQEPGVVGTWRDQSDPPMWVAPAGSIGLWHTGDIVTHVGQTWQSAIDNNTVEPDQPPRSRWQVVS